jgi:hypothetical protein
MRPSQSTIRALLLPLAVLAVLIPSSVRAQIGGGMSAGEDPFGADGPKRAPADASMIVRVYDVTDLVAHVPDYQYSDPALTRAAMGGPYGGAAESGMMGGMSGLGGTMPSAVGATAAAPGITVDSLVSAIASTCGRASWEEDGGPGVLHPLGYSLVVLQTNEVHQQIQRLLDELRKGSGKRTTVTIDARWLMLTSGELDMLTASDAASHDAIDRAVLAQFTRRPTSIRALTKCFSGQLVYMVSGTRQNIVTGVIPVVGSAEQPRLNDHPFAVEHNSPNPFMFVSQSEDAVRDRSVGYQSVVEKSNFGVLLEIRPTLVPNAQTAIVDLRSTVTALGKPMGVLAVPPAPPTGAPQVDRVAVDTLELATTLKLPLAQPVLIGGLTRVASSNVEAPAAARIAASPATPEDQENPQLYLILELLSDTDPAAVPAPKEKANQR